jgi:uncharacterized protein (TIGR03118 family)
MLQPRFIRDHTKHLVGLALVALVGWLILSGLPASASNPARVERQAAATSSSDQQPDLVTNNYKKTNLVSDIPGFAQIEDPLLVNPWGIAMSATSPFWVANAGSGTSTLYQGDVGGSPFVKNSLNVTIPGGLPTGTVFNGSSDFSFTGGGSTGPARFLFASITGRISAWKAGLTTAVVVVTQPAGNVYTGLAIGNNGTANFLYAANFGQKRIDVFDKNFAAATLAGSFTDPTLPADYAPFNIQNLGGKLHVAYAKVDPVTGEDLPGPGNGYVSVFDTNGNFLGRLVSNGPLSSPWGMVIAPSGFGAFPGALLVGNFGDGRLNAFNPTTGAFLGTLNDESGNPVSIDELWALTFGNGGNGGDPSTLYFTAGTAEEEHGIFGSLKVVTTPSPALVQFSSDEYAINEGTGSITITVTRTGDISGPATVNYATFDESQPGHANQKSDYQIAVGTLRFNPGETSKTFRILLEDDFYIEGDETVEMMLSNPIGAGLGSPSIAELTINDNDTGPSTTNPIDDAQFFVRQQYLDFLNRQPDAGGLAYWTNQITMCGANMACVNRRRREVATAFFVEQEFQQTGFFVQRFFKASLGTRISYEEFVVGRSKVQADPNLENGREAFAEDFVQRPDFIQKYGPTASNVCPTFVDALINTVQQGSGVNMTSRRFDLIGECNIYVNAGPIQRAKVVRKLIEYPEFINAEYNQSFVLAEYFGFLKRTPDVAGFNFWLNQLNSLPPPNNYIAMVCAFINSPEYQNRFYNVITHNDSECGVP